jgi:GH35 family endo-1,4-beta-xylanase
VTQVVPETRQRHLRAAGLQPRAVYYYRLIRHAFPFGTALNFERLFDSADTPEAIEYLRGYVRAFDEYFNAAVAEQTFKWHIVERSGTPDWSAADRAMVFVRARPWLRQRFRGHTVFWNRRAKLPTALQNASSSSMMDALFSERLRMLTRFDDIVDWDLLNEPLRREPSMVEGRDLNALVWSPDDDIDMFAELFRRAHALRPDARLFVNEYSILNGGKTDEYMRLIDRLLIAGAPVSGIGVQGHIRPKPFFASPEVAAGTPDHDHGIRLQRPRLRWQHRSSRRVHPGDDRTLFRDACGRRRVRVGVSG